MTGHTRYECKHGRVVTQCRCASPNKTIVIVTCLSDCTGEDVEREESTVFASEDERAREIRQAVLFAKRRGER